MIFQCRAKHHHNVYVIELDPGSSTSRAFATPTPTTISSSPPSNVGMTGLTPEERFAKHKAGVRANRYVQRFGLRLLPRLYAYANPMPYRPRATWRSSSPSPCGEQGYAVWQA